MEQSLGYLREILAAHTEDDVVGKKIYQRIRNRDYKDEHQFVMELSQEESTYLNQILKEAIDYSRQEQDYERMQQLNDVYEQLFV
ncbi:sigma-G-dependent sporulation-specific acid-soluble spore protein CsgA [Caldibacillus lycopersici]|uniref:Sigma-G-dependent sporulation-specific acid-soluble spore protein CsgA n=1 Tax=Perspicuibacillus lycopersici TaxID=1325689 RepID=A0AAE3LMS4_9BACI|nr:sigma-G-dependent sporulation-specific acid-soluble spore protein CsgA [Perspicuibacillus lycopersici]MCU9613226.1 sigma-G-dependent sporulation-specific acid-soluble spore protein CsgA [Perspicuibacillus lycopersici]